MKVEGGGGGGGLSRYVELLMVRRRDSFRGTLSGKLRNYGYHFQTFCGMAHVLERNWQKYGNYWESFIICRGMAQTSLNLMGTNPSGQMARPRLS